MLALSAVVGESFSGVGFACETFFGCVIGKTSFDDVVGEKKIIANPNWCVVTHHGCTFEQARRACPGCCWRVNTRLVSVEPRRVCCGESLPEFASNAVSG